MFRIRPESLASVKEMYMFNLQRWLVRFFKNCDYYAVKAWQFVTIKCQMLKSMYTQLKSIIDVANIL